MAKNDFLYRKVYDGILMAIQQQRLLPGQKLPCAASLMEEYGVSRITVDKALALLVEEGYLKRVPGQGSFVEEKKSAQVPSKPNGLKVIGVVLEHVSTPFGLDMMYRLELSAAENGYRTLVRFSLGDRKKETEEIEFLMSLGIEGLIIMPCHGKHYNPSLLKLYLEGFPVVMVDKNMQGIKLPSVRTDNAAAVRLLVETLAKQGSRCIALLTSDDANAVSVRERRRGFIDGIDAAGVTEAGIFPLPLKNTREELLSSEPPAEVMEDIRRSLESCGSEADAVICAEYSILPPLLHVLDGTCVIPDRDLRIAVVDEDYLAPEGYRFLHVKQDEAAIAGKAVELLMMRIQKKAVNKEDFLIPAVLKLQKSRR
jgi:GntR family transcriptional regulator of arabinose operon